jgi:hypothetical protein
MELVLTAFIGTVLLMAAELREFVQRGRPGSISTESSSAQARLEPRVSTDKSVAREEYLYDAAA